MARIQSRARTTQEGIVRNHDSGFRLFSSVLSGNEGPCSTCHPQKCGAGKYLFQKIPPARNVELAHKGFPVPKAIQWMGADSHGYSGSTYTFKGWPPNIETKPLALEDRPPQIMSTAVLDISQ
jgi:hypothetical protein